MLFSPFSLSAQDRETLERSKQAAAQARSTAAPNEQNPAAAGAGNSSIAASAVANHALHHMEVDELERELSGRA